MKLFVWIFCTALLWYNSANAASFDCTKARSAHEKHICANLELNIADTRLGEAYRAAAHSFPIKGFVLATEQRFLLLYQTCDGEFEPSCKSVLAERIAILETMVSPIAVYTNFPQTKVFAPYDGVFWIAISGKDLFLHYFGAAMPDMNTQVGFPEGFVCDDALPLVKVPSGYKATDHGDETTVTDQKITASIICSPRSGMDGDYARVR